MSAARLSSAVALIAFVTALLATPLVRRLAPHVGMLDATGERRMHDQPKPRIGGIAVFLGFAFALFSVLGYLDQRRSSSVRSAGSRRSTGSTTSSGCSSAAR